MTHNKWTLHHPVLDGLIADWAPFLVVMMQSTPNTSPRYCWADAGAGAGLDTTGAPSLLATLSMALLIFSILFVCEVCCRCMCGIYCTHVCCACEQQECMACVYLLSLVRSECTSCVGYSSRCLWEGFGSRCASLCMTGVSGAGRLA